MLPSILHIFVARVVCITKLRLLEILKNYHSRFEIKIHKSIKFVIKFVCPVFLLAIFTVWVIKSLPKRIENITHVEGLALGFIGIMLVFFLLLIASATKRWEKSGKGKVQS